jgi:hypothetical protein
MAVPSGSVEVVAADACFAVFAQQLPETARRSDASCTPGDVSAVVHTGLVPSGVGVA